MKESLKFTFIFFFIFNSCISEEGIYVEVTNISDKVVKDIKVFTSDQKSFVNFDNMRSQSSTEKFLDMSNTTESDGGYMINFIRENGSEHTSGGGYYTNGSPMDRKIHFTIKNDTVLVNTPLF